MSDEDKKRIFSEPPPPTDEIDEEWGKDVPEGVAKSQPPPPGAAVSGTAVAPISVPAKAAEASTPSEVKAATAVADDEDEDEDEDDDEDEDESADDEDEDEDEDEEQDARAQPLPPRAAAPSGSDWIPDWAPYAVLALLVSVSLVVGLGLLGGGPASASEEADKAAAPTPSTVKAPVKPSPHP